MSAEALLSLADEGRDVFAIKDRRRFAIRLIKRLRVHHFRIKSMRETFRS